MLIYLPNDDILLHFTNKPWSWTQRVLPETRFEYVWFHETRFEHVWFHVNSSWFVYRMKMYYCVLLHITSYYFVWHINPDIDQPEYWPTWGSCIASLHYEFCTSRLHIWMSHVTHTHTHTHTHDSITSYVHQSVCTYEWVMSLTPTPTPTPTPTLIYTLSHIPTPTHLILTSESLARVMSLAFWVMSHLKSVTSDI